MVPGGRFAKLMGFRTAWLGGWRVDVEFSEVWVTSWLVMKTALFAALSLSIMVVSSCVMPPPTGGPGFNAPPPPRVLMPIDLTVREQAYVPEIENVLRRAGYDPIYRGDADQLLEFTIDEGPINVLTFIRLVDHGRTVGLGEGRAAGPPLINRNQVLADSFYQALRMFEGRLSRPTTGYPAYR
jgi:hypothetical protein